MRTDFLSGSRAFALALIVLFILPLGAAAGTITFLDLADNVTFSTDTTRAVLFIGCTGGEACSVVLNPPALSISNVPLISPSGFINIAEPGTQQVSDQLATSGLLGLPGLRIDFSSDGEGIGRPCSSVNGCTVLEDGTIQTAFTATWNLSQGAPVVDTIQFQSDVEAPAGVPEPASALLAITGFGLLGGILRRRRRL